MGVCVCWYWPNKQKIGLNVFRHNTDAKLDSNLVCSKRFDGAVDKVGGEG